MRPAARSVRCVSPRWKLALRITMGATMGAAGCSLAHDYGALDAESDRRPPPAVAGAGGSSAAGSSGAAGIVGAGGAAGVGGRSGASGAGGSAGGGGGAGGGGDAGASGAGKSGSSGGDQAGASGAGQAGASGAGQAGSGGAGGAAGAGGAGAAGVSGAAGIAGSAGSTAQGGQAGSGGQSGAGQGGAGGALAQWDVFATTSANVTSLAVNGSDAFWIEDGNVSLKRRARSGGATANLNGIVAAGLPGALALTGTALVWRTERNVLGFPLAALAGDPESLNSVPPTDPPPIVDVVGTVDRFFWATDTQVFRCQVASSAACPGTANPVASGPGANIKRLTVSGSTLFVALADNRIVRAKWEPSEPFVPFYEDAVTVAEDVVGLATTSNSVHWVSKQGAFRKSQSDGEPQKAVFSEVRKGTFVGPQIVKEQAYVLDLNTGQLYRYDASAASPTMVEVGPPQVDARLFAIDPNNQHAYVAASLEVRHLQL